MFWVIPDMVAVMGAICEEGAKAAEERRKAFLATLEGLDQAERQRRIERYEDIQREERHHRELVAATRRRNSWFR